MTRCSRNARLALVPLRAVARNESGATAIEYALIAAGIAMAIVIIVPQVGTTVAGLFTDVAGIFS